MVVRVDPDDPRWDALVEGHADAGVYHLSAWARVLQRAYGYVPRYLAIQAPDGRLVAGLPAMESRGLVAGRRIRSLPVVPAVGPLAETPDQRAALLSACCELTAELGAWSWTLQAREPRLAELEPRLHGAVRSAGWTLPLPPDPSELRTDWRSSSTNLHRSLARSERAGLTVRGGTAADLRRFHLIYAATMRTHSVLPRTLRQMELARELLPAGVFRLFVVEHRGAVIAGGVFHDFNGTVDLLYNASDANHLDLRPNHALYWHVIRWAIERGRATFDFGRALRDTPLARFKSQWGSEPVDEHRYEFRAAHSSTRRERRSGVVDRLALTHGRRSPIELAWSRTPIALTRAAGSMAYRWL